MKLNPLDFIKKTLGSLAGNIPIVGGAIQDLLMSVDEEWKKLTPSERLALEEALRRDATENFRLALQDSADMRKLAMAQLEHPGIKWIRPGILAGSFLLIAFHIALVPIIAAFGFTIPAPDMAAIPGELWWFFGSAYLGYGTMREIGKRNKLKALNGQ